MFALVAVSVTEAATSSALAEICCEVAEISSIWSVNV